MPNPALDTDALANGIYTGFVEWRSPPDRGNRPAMWVLGFFAGFAIKAALILYLGAEFIPT